MRNAAVEIQGKGQGVQSFWLAGRQVVVNYGNTYSRKMSFKILKEQSSQKYRRESPRFKNFEFAPPLKRPRRLLRHILAHSPLSWQLSAVSTSCAFVVIIILGNIDIVIIITGIIFTKICHRCHHRLWFTIVVLSNDNLLIVPFAQLKPTKLYSHYLHSSSQKLTSSAVLANSCFFLAFA